MALTLDLLQQSYRGKAPTVFIAQPEGPEGLGCEFNRSRRAKGAKGLAVSPTHNVRQFRFRAFGTTTKLILIGELRMVRFLILDGTLDFVQVGITHRKYAVSGLPRKALIFLGKRFAHLEVSDLITSMSLQIFHVRDSRTSRWT